MASNDEIYLLNQDQELVKMISTDEFTETFGQEAVDVSLDDNGILIMAIGGPCVQKLISYNLNTNMLIDSYEIADVCIFDIKINGQGSYIKWQDTDKSYGLEISDGAFGTAVELTGSYPLFSSNGNDLYTFSDENLFVYNISGSNLIRTETIPNSSYMRYVDYNSGFISWVSNDNTFFVYDPAISKLVYELPIHGNGRYFNGYAISRYGFSLFLDL